MTATKPTARKVTVFAVSLMIDDSATLWLAIHHGDTEDTVVK
jgi:hypothetical protein